MPSTNLKVAFPLKVLANQAIPQPPGQAIPVTDVSWVNWFYRVYASLGQSGGGIFPKLIIGNTSFTTENDQQQLLTLNQGLYVNYSSTIGNICYGYACNVYRAGGVPFVVGAQINAIQTVQGGSGVFGIACTAYASPRTGSVPVVAIEPDCVNASSANTSAKWGMNVVFKNRGDGAPTVTEGLASNLYNYFSSSMVVNSQARSSAGEFCGWSVGLQFLDAWCDQFTVPSWDSSVTYSPGQITLSGGFLWKAVATNTNSLPAVANANWIKYALNTTPYAVGIDFSPLSVTTMSRMWSAIRLRNTMPIHWEETGAVATYMDSANGRLVLCGNYNVGLAQYTRQFQVDVTNGNLWVNNGIVGLGGGAAPTFGTIGGSGPGTAAQRGWYKIIDGTTSTAFYVPVWQ